MPELPEVETIRRQLCSAGVQGKTIEKVSIHWPRTVEPLSPPAFRKRVTGRKIDRLSRHGKWLIFELDEIDNLLVHLRMTGGFYLSEGWFKKGPHDRAIFQLSDGMNLHFRDPRKFGRFRLESGVVGYASRIRERVLDEEHKLSEYREACPTIAGLGPDAMEIPARPFFQTLEKSNRMLKPLLLDQSFIAGVGNIYADEALFEARLRPDRRSGSLSERERLALWEAITKVIRLAVENGGTSLGGGQGNYRDLNGNSGGHREQTKVYGRAGKPCVECSCPLEKTVLAQRTTVFCAVCQT